MACACPGARSLGCAAVALLSACNALVVEPSWQDSDGGRPVSEIEITTADVFSEAEASERPLYAIVNALHATSRRELIERILWVDPGDVVSPDKAAELERELRRTGLFGEARVELRDDPENADAATLAVSTEDRLSLIFGAGGFLVGGVGGVDAQIGENNLFGNGDRVQLSHSGNSVDERRTELSFTDRHFLDEEHRASVSLADSEEGFEGAVGVEKRLRHLEDDGRWSAVASSREVRVDYFEGGDSVAEVPRETLALRAERAFVSGPRDRRLELGLRADWSAERFGAALGPQAASIEVPGDVSSARAAAFGSLRGIAEFRRETGLDALGFVEDLELGARVFGSLGADWRDEAGVTERLAPVASLGLGTLFEPADGTLVSLESSGVLRWNAGEALGWSASGAARLYQRITPTQVLALSGVVESVFEGEGLPAELTLGEDNGLRGFPAREFAGDRRARLNLEYRLVPGLELRSLQFGLTPFVDCAWIDTDRFGEPLASAGLGLRIGSPELLGGGVIRIDLAFPVVEPDGADYSPSVSVSLGQVFTLFGNAAALASN